VRISANHGSFRRSDRLVPKTKRKGKGKSYVSKPAAGHARVQGASPKLLHSESEGLTVLMLPITAHHLQARALRQVGDRFLADLFGRFRRCDKRRSASEQSMPTLFFRSREVGSRPRAPCSALMPCKSFPPEYRSSKNLTFKEVSGIPSFLLLFLINVLTYKLMVDLKKGISPSKEPNAEIMEWFADPYAAFPAAWLYQAEKLSKPLQDAFPRVLQSCCGHRTVDRRQRLRGKPGDALGHFTNELNRLLDLWLDEQPPARSRGQLVAHWYYRHQQVLEQIQHAQVAWTSYDRIDITEEPDRFVLVPPSGDAVEAMPLSLPRRVQMLGQRDYRQAAECAARALFGIFLRSSPENIARCDRCNKPFIKGQKKQFCSEKCTKEQQVARHHARARLKQMQSLNETLGRELKKPVLGRNWVRVLQDEAGFTTRDNRLNPALSRYLSAAKGHDSEALLNMLDLERSAPSAEQAQNRIKIAEELGELLERIREAQRREKLGGKVR
jgi:hypothetical protein